MACPCCSSGSICVIRRTCDRDRPQITITVPGITATSPFNFNYFSPTVYCQGSSATYPQEFTYRVFQAISASTQCLGGGRCKHIVLLNYRAFLNFADERTGSRCTPSPAISTQPYMVEVFTNHGYVESTTVVKNGAFTYEDASLRDFTISCLNPAQPGFSAACIAAYGDDVAKIQTPPLISVSAARATGYRECRNFTTPVSCLHYTTSNCEYYIRLFGNCTGENCPAGYIEDADALAACGFVPPNPLP